MVGLPDQYGLLQPPQETGLLGINERLSSLATDPLFNIGIGMLGSRSPHFGNALAAGGQQMQQGVMLGEKMKDQSFNRDYRKQMLELAKQRTQQKRTIQGADGYTYYEDGTRVLPNVQAPQTPKFEDITDANGNIIAQRDPTSNAYKPISQGGTNGPSPTFKRALHLPDGTVQDQEWHNGEYVPVGAPYQSRDPWKQVTKLNPITGQVEIGWVDTRTIGQGGLPQGEGDMPQNNGPNVVTLPDSGQPANADQSKAYGFANRLFNSANTLATVDPYGSVASNLTDSALNKIPGAGNYLVTPEFQQAEQARRDATNAVLRRESGAVIGPSEFESANLQYFPQPGDSGPVIAQKRKNLITQYEALYESSGPLKSKLKTPAELAAIFDNIKKENDKKQQEDPLGLR